MIINNLYMIVAMTERSNAIGKDGGMLYHLPSDLKYFKETTLNKTVLMGYATYMSLPKRPLPNRKNIVVSKKLKDIDNCIVLNSIEDILDYAQKKPSETIFVCGGESIYKQLLPYASKLYITYIEENSIVEADRFFPKFDTNVWTKVKDTVQNDIKKLHFTIWERKDEKH